MKSFIFIYVLTTDFWFWVVQSLGRWSVCSYSRKWHHRQYKYQCRLCWTVYVSECKGLKVLTPAGALHHRLSHCVLSHHLLSHCVQVQVKLPVLQEVSWLCWRVCRTLLTWRSTKTWSPGSSRWALMSLWGHSLQVNVSCLIHLVCSFSLHMLFHQIWPHKWEPITSWELRRLKEWNWTGNNTCRHL